MEEPVTITLPKAEKGAEFTMIVNSATTFRLEPYEGDRISIKIKTKNPFLKLLIFIFNRLLKTYELFIDTNNTLHMTRRKK